MRGDVPSFLDFLRDMSYIQPPNRDGITELSSHFKEFLAHVHRYCANGSVTRCHSSCVRILYASH